MKNKKITVGSLFAGIGGFCKAFELEGAKVLWANDNDKYTKITYEANYKNRFILKDIEDLSVSGDELEPVDILTAGFPCQPFSIAGRRNGFDDPRGNVFWEIIRIVNEFGKDKPKIIFLENVKNFRNNKYLRHVIEGLDDAGYWFDERFARVLNTKDYTYLPQNRERLFMIALNKQYFDNVPPKFPKSRIHKNSSPYDFLHTDKVVDEKYYFKQTSQYYPMFKEKMDEYDTNEKKNIYLLRRWYVRPYLNGATPTLTANMGTGGHNVPVIRDQWGIRKLTIQECSRLQGFHENWFKIPKNISRAQIYKQIGNAVSVPLIRKMAKILIRELKRKNLA